MSKPYPLLNSTVDGTLQGATDGVNDEFIAQMGFDANAPVMVFLNGVLASNATGDNNYSILWGFIGKFKFNGPPAVDSKVEVLYYPVGSHG